MIENMNNESEILKILKDQDSRLKRIETSLIGDYQLGSSGLVKRLDHTEQKVNTLKGKLDKV